MLAQITSSQALCVQKDVCIVDCASGLPGTVLELSGFNNCSYWRFRVRECVTRVPAVLVSPETEVIAHLFHSYLNPELAQFIVLKFFWPSSGTFQCCHQFVSAYTLVSARSA